MDIDPARMDLEHNAPDDNSELSTYVPIHAEWTDAAGHHRIRDGRSVIGIRDDQATRPMALIATIATNLATPCYWETAASSPSNKIMSRSPTC